MQILSRLDTSLTIQIYKSMLKEKKKKRQKEKKYLCSIGIVLEKELFSSPGRHFQPGQPSTVINADTKTPLTCCKLNVHVFGLLIPPQMAKKPVSLALLKLIWVPEYYQTHRRNRDSAVLARSVRDAGKAAFWKAINRPLKRCGSISFKPIRFRRDDPITG